MSDTDEDDEEAAGWHSSPPPLSPGPPAPRPLPSPDIMQPSRGRQIPEPYQQVPEPYGHPEPHEPAAWPGDAAHAGPPPGTPPESLHPGPPLQPPSWPGGQSGAVTGVRSGSGPPRFEFVADVYGGGHDSAEPLTPDPPALPQAASGAAAQRPPAPCSAWRGGGVYGRTAPFQATQVHELLQAAAWGGRGGVEQPAGEADVTSALVDEVVARLVTAGLALGVQAGRRAVVADGAACVPLLLDSRVTEALVTDILAEHLGALLGDGRAGSGPGIPDLYAGAGPGSGSGSGSAPVPGEAIMASADPRISLPEASGGLALQRQLQEVGGSADQQGQDLDPDLDLVAEGGQVGGRSGMPPPGVPGGEPEEAEAMPARAGALSTSPAGSGAVHAPVPFEAAVASSSSAGQPVRAGSLRRDAEGEGVGAGADAPTATQQQQVYAVLPSPYATLDLELEPGLSLDPMRAMQPSQLHPQPQPGPQVQLPGGATNGPSSTGQQPQSPFSPPGHQLAAALPASFVPSLLPGEWEWVRVGVWGGAWLFAW